MAHTISIDLLQSKGACMPDCLLLRQAYPDGIVVFDMALLPKLQTLGVNIFWGVLLLTPSVQKELATAWYNRALTGQMPPWKTAHQALINDPNSSATALLKDRLKDRQIATDEAGVSVAGVGYAAALFAVQFSKTDPDPLRALATLSVLAQWCSRCIAALQSKNSDAVYAELQADVWQKLEQYGATL